MTKTVSRIGAVAAAMLLLTGASALAKTVAVGPSTCQPTLAHYSTIQAAVDAVQSGGTSNTVLVCPGTYPEQVVISQPITIKGVEHENSLESRITVPPGGLRPVATTPSGVFSAQVVAQNAIGVKLIGLTIDGAGATCPTEAGASRTAGVLFYHIGDPATQIFGGQIQQLSVVNQHDGCSLADGIVAEDSYITITTNSVHDVDRDAILQIGGFATITTNVIQGGHHSGIMVSGGSKTSLTGNTVAHSQYGVYLDNTQDVVVRSSDFGPYVGVGVYVASSSGIEVTSNKFFSNYAGIWTHLVTGSLVKSNVITKTDAFGLVDAFSGGNNQYTGNTIIEAPFGFYTYYEHASDTLSPNTLVNVRVKRTSNPW
jgi:parallel beta-helix repeat protein